MNTDSRSVFVSVFWLFRQKLLKGQGLPPGEIQSKSPNGGAALSPLHRSSFPRGNRRRHIVIFGALVAVVAAALFLSGCSTTARWVTVQNVLSSPDEFTTRPVWIAGTVTQAMALPGVGQSVYEVSDGTASIVVLTRNGVPAEGSRVAVQGRAQVGLKLQLGSVLNKTLGVVFVEANRQSE